jgi:uncharacterized C2H2 Zn-finger protein
MNIDTTKKIRKKNLLILLFAILILVINVSLPLVSIKIVESTEMGTEDEITEESVEENRYLSLEAMKVVDNETLSSLSKSIDEINLMLWAIIILGLVSFLCLILKLSELLKIIPNIFILSDFAALILSAIIFQILFVSVQKINNSAEIFSFFIYVSLALSIILFVISLYCTISIMISLLKDIKSAKKVNKIGDMNTKKIKKVAFKEDESVGKHIKFKMDDYSKKKTEDSGFLQKKETGIYDEKYTEKKLLENEKQNQEKKLFSGPFQTRNDKKIEKKAIPVPSEELKKFNVKCPECESVFQAEKQLDGITKIKCPKCGKEGVIK